MTRVVRCRLDAFEPRVMCSCCWLKDPLGIEVVLCFSAEARQGRKPEGWALR